MPIRRVAFAFVLGLATLLQACGSDSAAPTGPTPSAPAAVTVAGLVVTGPETIVAGSTVQFTATARMSNGTQSDVTSSAQWSLDSSARVSLGSTGMLTAHSQGLLKVTAAYSGASGSASSRVVPPVLLDTLNDSLENLDGEPSFRRGEGSGNEAFDDFVSPITTDPHTLTFQGIRCGSERQWIFVRFYRSAGDLPDRNNYIQYYWDESSLIKSIDGIAPRACPGGRDGTLVTYRAFFLEYTVTASERNWISIFAYYDNPNWNSPDQWQLRHGKPGNGYAAAYRTSGTFVRQTRDFAVRLE